VVVGAPYSPGETRGIRSPQLATAQFSLMGSAAAIHYLQNTSDPNPKQPYSKTWRFDDATMNYLSELLAPPVESVAQNAEAAFPGSVPVVSQALGKTVIEEAASKPLFDEAVSTPLVGGSAATLIAVMGNNPWSSFFIVALVMFGSLVMLLGRDSECEKCGARDNDVTSRKIIDTWSDYKDITRRDVTRGSKGEYLSETTRVEQVVVNYETMRIKIRCNKCGHGWKYTSTSTSH